MRSSAPEDAETATLQQAAQEALRIATRKPYTHSKRIPVLLIAGVVKVPHGLSRKPAGWLLHTILGASSCFVATAPDTVNISITAGAPGSCILEVW